MKHLIPYQALRQTPIDTLLQRLKSVSDTLDNSLTDSAVKEMITALLFAISRSESPVHLTQRIRKDRHKLPPLRKTIQAHETAKIIEEIQSIRAISRQKNRFPGQHQLDPFRNDILQLRRAKPKGASIRDIVTWLRTEHQVFVSAPTVHRYLKANDKDDKTT